MCPEVPIQWSFAQDSLEAIVDPQVVANGYIGDATTAKGVDFQLVTAPVQFDGVPAAPKRAPGFNEHCDEILAGLGFDLEAVMELKVDGVVA